MSDSKTVVISKGLHMICKQVALDAGVKLETVINTAIEMSLNNKELYKKLKRA